ncbi:MAG: glutathionylspermidine synthase family protein [Planctomycetes bacterium]|nr:glutathionylspermidine synthase family protein [Planctomycetota bacterium]
MFRYTLEPRPNWQKRVEAQGLMFHTLHGEKYWDESAAYQFTAQEVDNIELATNTLHQMCLDLVQEVIDEKRFDLFFIPEQFRPWIIQSWEASEPSLYGRFDFAYDGNGPPKMLEYNADTPTGLVEAAVAQWYWLKDIDERGDQFNSIHERLINAWKGIRARWDLPVHFAALGGVPEDYITVEYLRDTAIQAGFETKYLDVEQIGWSDAMVRFVDMSGNPIRTLFKLYPWEWMLREGFGPRIPTSRTHFLEPPWKMLLSCKSILPLLYEKYPDSPFLLPAWFEPPRCDHVRKPLHAREGSNIQVVQGGQVRMETGGPYEGPYIYQQFAPLRSFDDRYAILGSWVVDGVSCGMGVREDDTPITTNLSRFIPHQMV